MTELTAGHRTTVRRPSIPMAATPQPYRSTATIVLVGRETLVTDALSVSLSRQGTPLHITAALDVTDAVEKSPDASLIAIYAPIDDVLLEGVLRTAGTLAPQLRVFVLAPRFHLVSGQLAAAYGAIGYWTLRDGLDDVVWAICEAVAGRATCTPAAAPYVVPDDGYLRGGLVEMHGPLRTLTPREFSVFERVAAGDDDAVIASRLGISLKRVRNVKTQILRRLNLGRPEDLLIFAAKQGLL